jgi:hypothetical protein
MTYAIIAATLQMHDRAVPYKRSSSTSVLMHLGFQFAPRVMSLKMFARKCSVGHLPYGKKSLMPSSSSTRTIFKLAVFR